MDEAFEYVIKTGGIDTEASYAYTAKDGQCHYNASNSGATISRYFDIESGNESALTAAVHDIGPISVAIDASNPSFMFYESGIYYEPDCHNKRSQLDHGVLVVGYGFITGGVDYYLVKNSWGWEWGEEGYALMVRNKGNNCGIATAASFPLV